MRTSLLLLGLLLAGTSCSKAPHATTVKILTIDNDPANAAAVEVDGVRMEIAGDLKPELGIYNRASTGSTQMDFAYGDAAVPFDNKDSGVWIRLNPITVVDGHVMVGDRDFGRVKKGEAVAIDLAGVHVGKELRGELPPRP